MFNVACQHEGRTALSLSHLLCPDHCPFQHYAEGRHQTWHSWASLLKEGIYFHRAWKSGLMDVCLTQWPISRLLVTPFLETSLLFSQAICVRPLKEKISSNPIQYSCIRTTAIAIALLSLYWLPFFFSFSFIRTPMSNSSGCRACHAHTNRTVGNIYGWASKIFKPNFTARTFFKQVSELIED